MSRRPPQFQQFKPWRPDQGTFNAGQSEEARGVIKTATGYRPFPGFVAANVDSLPGDPATSRPTGLFFGKTVEGNAEQFAAVYDAGANSTTNSYIWKLDSAGRWDEAGQSADLWNITKSDRFRHVQWESTLVVTNYINYLRTREINGTNASWFYVPGRGPDNVGTWDVATAYLDGEQVFYTSTIPGQKQAWEAVRNNTGITPTEGDDWTRVTDQEIQPKYLAIIRDFLVCAYLDEQAFDVAGVPRGGLHPDRVRWSGINQPFDFALAGDPAVLSDFQDVPDAGEVRGIVGGEYGVVLCENGIFRMDFVGPPAVFSFNRIERARGCIEPNSVVVANNIVYYLSDDGWKQFDGQQIQPFGAERFDRWFRTNATQSVLSSMTAFVDPNNQLIVWGFDATKEIVDINDRILIYNYALNEPTYSYLDHSLLGSFITPARDIDSVDGVLLDGLLATDDWKGRWLGNLAYAVDDVVSYVLPDADLAEVDWRGIWSETITNYAVNDLVYLFDDGRSDKERVFRCIQTIPAGEEANYGPWSSFRPDVWDPSKTYSDNGVGTSDTVVDGLKVYRCTVTTTTSGAAPSATPGEWDTVGDPSWEYFWIRETDTVNKLSAQAYRCSGTIPVYVANTDTVTFDSANDRVIWATHGQSENSVVRFTTTGTLPATLAVATQYYVIAADLLPDVHFQVSLLPNGAPIAFATNGTGTHTAIAVDGVPPAFDPEVGGLWDPAETWNDQESYDPGDIVLLATAGKPEYLANKTTTAGENPLTTGAADWNAIEQWDAATSYSNNDWVYFTTTVEPIIQQAWQANIGTTTGQSPEDDPDNWDLFTYNGSETVVAHRYVTASIENLNIPWDSTVFKPDAQIFGGISRKEDGTDRFHIFSGFPEVSVIDSEEFRANPVGYALLNKIQPAIEGDSPVIEIQIGTRDRLGVPVTWSDPYTIQPDDSFRPRQNARYHRVRVNITSSWRDATGAFGWATPTSAR